MKNTVFSPAFMVLGLLFCVCLILSNLLAAKLLQVGPFVLPAAVLVFPISYIINDCIAEVWGWRRARLIIWTGFAMNFFVVAVLQLAVLLPGASFWTGAEHFNAVFGLAPRVAAASFLAFLVGSFLNAGIMSAMKVASQGRHFSLRAVVSTIVGESADSAVFLPCAFLGLMPVSEMAYMMLAQVSAKTLYEIAVLPLTARIVDAVKRHEGTDVYDTDVSYSIWRIREI
ncbi:MAG: queuosine precursor transporter [Mailhella sp.]|nr:queuosine precursor transporter [Mailhella sp.]